ncbi:MAG: HDIG domain-containing metalloprotein [bacterium]
MERQEGLKLVKSKLKNKNLVKHALATQSCMEALAQHFGEDEEAWTMAGLLHDLDYEDTKDDFSLHGFVTSEMLEKEGVDKEIIEAIKAHPGHIERTSKMAKALYAVDPLTGLIVSATIMHPEKRLSAVDTEFVLRRFKEKRFAAGANREQINACQELGLELSEFVTICLEAMQRISKELGL